MVPADKARLLRANMLLERRNKVDVLLQCEGHEHTNRTVKDTAPAGPRGGHHRDFVNARNEVARVEAEPGAASCAACP